MGWSLPTGTTPAGGGGGTTDHAALASNLAWATSGHTGTGLALAGFTAGNAAAEYTLTAFAITLLDDANQAAAWTTLGATATPTASKIVVSDSAGKVDGWLSFPPQLAFAGW